MTAGWIPSSSERVFGAFTVRTELCQNGRVVDALSHPLTFWRPKPPAERAWVTAHDGCFWLAGKRWAPNGVNYMPSSGIGLEDNDTRELDRREGLRPGHLAMRTSPASTSLGMNSISVFIHRSSMEARNLFDLLARRQDWHHLKVNLSLRPHADPFDFNWNEVRGMITYYRLPECDTIFAYDLASGAPDWSLRAELLQRPVAESSTTRSGRSGSSSATAPSQTPRPIGRTHSTYSERRGDRSSDRMLEVNGPYLRMVAAYRRFVDDLASRAYGRAARLIRGLDPHHLFGFRMNTAGDPTAAPREFPFDFRGLGRALDIVEPEGYGRQGDWNRVRDGAFTVAYSRYAAPRPPPVMWSEFEVSTWSGSNFLQPNPAQAARLRTSPTSTTWPPSRSRTEPPPGGCPAATASTRTATSASSTPTAPTGTSPA